ncbi:MAG: hypothetical protein OEQ90_08425 [Gammaproteobacteria bacterium]|nr:hypothetical protein [Gammaproteobacteria bacterium]
MRRLVGWVACLVVASTMMTTSMALDEDFDVRVAVAQTEEMRDRVVRANIELTTEEADKFWPLYVEYREKLGPVTREQIEVVVEYSKVHTNLSDAKATSLFDEWLSLRKKESKIKSKYLKKFRRILSPKHAIRYVQIENKLDAAIEWNAAVNIPLVDR